MKSQNHLQWIDFLRGFSAIGIILYHVRVDLWVGWVAIRTSPSAYSTLDRTLAWLSLPMPLFGSAVMLFFLVSGFCIHFPYANASRSLEIKSYAERRLFRIYPPYLAAVLFTLLVEVFAAHFYGGHYSSRATVTKSLFMVQNYGSHPGQMAFNPSLWSLPVEVELYFVYPLFYWLLRRHGTQWAFLSVAAVSMGALALSLGNLPQGLLNISGHFAVYWIIWGAGALLAEGVKRKQLPQWKPWMWLVVSGTLALALWSYARHASSEVQDLAWASFYFFVLLWGLTQEDPLRRWNARARRVFAVTGLISYSLYLVHFPFFKLCGLLWVAHFGTKPASLLIPLIFCGFAICLAYLFYLWVEAPSHRYAQRVSKRNVHSAEITSAEINTEPVTPNR